MLPQVDQIALRRGRKLAKIEEKWKKNRKKIMQRAAIIVLVGGVFVAGLGADASREQIMNIFGKVGSEGQKVFLNKTFIIWIMLLSTVLNRYLFYYLYKYYYKFSTYKLLFGFNIKPLWYVSLIYILIPLSFILLIWYRDKYYKKNYLLMFIVLMIVINQVIAYTMGDIIEKLIANFGGLLAIVIGLIFTQLFYNFFRRLSYKKYKDF